MMLKELPRARESRVSEDSVLQDQKKLLDFLLEEQEGSDLEKDDSHSKELLGNEEKTASKEYREQKVADFDQNNSTTENDMNCLKRLLEELKLTQLLNGSRSPLSEEEKLKETVRIFERITERIVEDTDHIGSYEQGKKIRREIEIVIEHISKLIIRVKESLEDIARQINTQTECSNDSGEIFSEIEKEFNNSINLLESCQHRLGTQTRNIFSNKIDKKLKQKDDELRQKNFRNENKLAEIKRQSRHFDHSKLVEKKKEMERIAGIYEQNGLMICKSHKQQEINIINLKLELLELRGRLSAKERSRFEASSSDSHRYFLQCEICKLTIADHRNTKNHSYLICQDCLEYESLSEKEYELWENKVNCRSLIDKNEREISYNEIDYGFLSDEQECEMLKSANDSAFSIDERDYEICEWRSEQESYEMSKRESEEEWEVCKQEDKEEEHEMSKRESEEEWEVCKQEDKEEEHEMSKRESEEEWEICKTEDKEEEHEMSKWESEEEWEICKTEEEEGDYEMSKWESEEEWKICKTEDGRVFPWDEERYEMQKSESDDQFLIDEKGYEICEREHERPENDLYVFSSIFE